MSRTPSPALAFYLRHPADFDALGDLDEAPKGVSAEDWQKFSDVAMKAGEHAANVVIACRDRAVQAFSTRFRVNSKTRPPKARQSWWANAEMHATKPNALKSFYLVCGLGADPDERTFLYSCVMPARAAERKDLLDRLKAAKLSVLPADWIDDDCITLALVPVDPKTDLEAAMAACVQPLLELARAL